MPGKSLEDYAAAHPMPDSPPGWETGAGLGNVLERRAAEKELAQKADREKAAILDLVRHGAPLETVLFRALPLIGALTHDSTWADATGAILGALCADLDQQSLLWDTQRETEKRLDDMQAQFFAKTRGKLKSAVAAQSKLQSALQTAIDALDALQFPAGAG